MFLRIVRAGFRRRHAVALPAIERDVDFQWLGQQRARPKLIEDVMGIKGAVVTADAGMVAPDDQMRAAEVLADQSVQERLARAGITHLDRIARLDDRAGAEIIVDHRLDRARSDIGRNVARFQFARVPDG